MTIKQRLFLAALAVTLACTGSFVLSTELSYEAALGVYSCCGNVADYPEEGRAECSSLDATAACPTGDAQCPGENFTCCESQCNDPSRAPVRAF